MTKQTKEWVRLALCAIWVLAVAWFWFSVAVNFNKPMIDVDTGKPAQFSDYDVNGGNIPGRP